MDVLHDDIGDMRSGLSHLFVRLANRNPRRIHRHKKGADMRVFGERLFTRARHDQGDARERCIRDVTLGTIQNIAIAAAHCACLHPGAVRSATGFGEAKRGNLTGGKAWQPMCALFRRSAFNDGRACHPDIDRDDRTESWHCVR